jgi:hypothetical protein|tara:strand:- start:3827 stop:4213 length:387 start_codon:yes stop_codon:yes gene_type:complete
LIVDSLLAERGVAVDDDVRRILEMLPIRLGEAGLHVEIKKRGYFGKVLRASQGPVFFDALPARHWVRFYFSRAANGLPGLAWDRLRDAFAEAEQRPKDLVVSIRLRDKDEAGRLCSMIAAVVSPGKGS